MVRIPVRRDMPIGEWCRLLQNIVKNSGEIKITTGVISRGVDDITTLWIFKSDNEVAVLNCYFRLREPALTDTIYEATIDFKKLGGEGDITSDIIYTSVSAVFEKLQEAIDRMNKARNLHEQVCIIDRDIGYLVAKEVRKKIEEISGKRLVRKLMGRVERIYDTVKVTIGVADYVVEIDGFYACTISCGGNLEDLPLMKLFSRFLMFDMDARVLLRPM